MYPIIEHYLTLLVNITTFDFIILDCERLMHLFYNYVSFLIFITYYHSFVLATRFGELNMLRFPIWLWFLIANEI